LQTVLHVDHHGVRVVCVQREVSSVSRSSPLCSVVEQLQHNQSVRVRFEDPSAAAAAVAADAGDRKQSGSGQQQDAKEEAKVEKPRESKCRRCVVS
jgi:hypothetical protein